jgi:hypothetical protein
MRVNHVGPVCDSETNGRWRSANLSRNFAIEEKNTVGFMVPDTPMTAATPDLVGIAPR